MARRFATKAATVAVFTGLAVSSGMVLGGVSSAEPAADPPSSTLVSFKAVGAPQTFTVPAGVTTLGIRLWGGTSNTNNGDGTPVVRWGGSVAGRLDVTPGQVLTVVVGGYGTSGNKQTAQEYKGLGGYNGGGSGGRSCVSPEYGGQVGSGGGGATDIRIGGTGLANRVAVAGGAGGAGLTTRSSAPSPLGGAGGASVGGIGGGATATAGKGGSQTAGGAAGTSTGDSRPTITATSGAAGVGGRGAGGSAYTGCTGGGGGGFYGGGGGGFGDTTVATQGGGGGGGSNYVGRLTYATSLQGDSSVQAELGYLDAYGNGGAGFATITYTAP